MQSPPFGEKSSYKVINAEGEAEREDMSYLCEEFWATTSNKQLNFLQHVRSLLTINGRAAIVVPDNVLFEGGAGETVRRRLLEQCDVHTLLRLPTGTVVSSSRGGTPINSLPPRDSPPADLAELLAVPRFPRCAGYDPEWVIANQMGPNVLWLTEFLSQAMDLRPGMRVLDMGCGKALSSIFLAREFGVQVWAADLWIPAADNLGRVQEAGLEDLVFPVHAEAHALPFAEGFFDAAISVDAYHYFGTDDLYLGYFARFVRPDVHIGIVVPGVRQEIGPDIPSTLRTFWHWDFGSFHTTAWWRAHWEKTGLVDIATADILPNGWEIWLQWEEMWEKIGRPSPHGNVELLRADTGHLLEFTRLVARRRVEPLYPSPLYSS